MISYDKEVWTFRQAAAVRPWERYGLYILVFAGLLSILALADWWFRKVHLGQPLLYATLTLILWWGIFRTAVLWVGYLFIRKPVAVPVQPGRRVAIFTTSSPGEPLAMFEKTLAACARIRYPHTTYLLDDTQDPRFRAMAARHGAVWLELVGIPGAKAGKINAALSLTQEDFILVLDPDHIPFPNFLDEVLGFFDDPRVGFVQVAQAYYNQLQSFVARGAAEQTYTFYGPTQMSLHGLGAAVAIGANCCFRREALLSIGGHGIGLAEDLVTSIRMHSRGWKSVYHPVVVSRGLVPEDMGSFGKQQLKWARGVHEVLFAELPRAWRGLTGWQRLSYLSIGTYYLNGLVTSLFLIIPFLYLWFGLLPANMDFAAFVAHWLPLALLSVIIYGYVQRWLCHPEQERGLHWRGMLLKFACWPVAWMGFASALMNAQIPYIPTAKQAAKGLSPFIRPMLVQQLVFLLTFIGVVLDRRYVRAEAALALSSGYVWGMMAFAAIAFLVSLGAVYAAWASSGLEPESPWDIVDDSLN